MQLRLSRFPSPTGRLQVSTVSDPLLDQQKLHPRCCHSASSFLALVEQLTVAVVHLVKNQREALVVLSDPSLMQPTIYQLKLHAMSYCRSLGWTNWKHRHLAHRRPNVPRLCCRLRKNRTGGKAPCVPTLV
jgi:hypothetical protein